MECHFLHGMPLPAWNAASCMEYGIPCMKRLAASVMYEAHRQPRRSPPNTPTRRPQTGLPGRRPRGHWPAADCKRQVGTPHAFIQCAWPVHTPAGHTHQPRAHVGRRPRAVHTVCTARRSHGALDVRRRQSQAAYPGVNGCECARTRAGRRARVRGLRRR
eukprot:265258-Chlamydomonas_euryale.AAC.1